MKRKNGRMDFQKNFLTKASIRAQQKKARQLYAPDDGDLTRTPLAGLCLGINYILRELERRGIPVYDFDNKTKVVRQVQIIGEKVYFLAEEESGDEEGQTKEGCRDV